MSISRSTQPFTPPENLPSLELSESSDTSPKTVVIDPIDILTNRFNTSFDVLRERRISFRDQKKTDSIDYKAESILFPQKK